MSADVEYYVVFTQAKRMWFRWLLKRGFSHCFVVRKEYGQVWTIIENTHAKLSVSSYLVEDYPSIHQLVPNTTIVQVIPDNRKHYHLSVMNCVEVVKSIIGLYAP